jgi:DNA-binding GntR family transcriptional regulator
MSSLRPSSPDLAHLSTLEPLQTAAERAADVIRENIFEGRFQPGMALPENSFAQALQVSRNTIREAFRYLIGEHLLAYEPHKGVSVRRLTAADVRDIYGLRRMIEGAAIQLLVEGKGALDKPGLQASFLEGDEAAEKGNWVEAGTANLRFHSQIVDLHNSPRLIEFFRRLMTEMRLGFLALPDPKAFHEPYWQRNHKLLNLLLTGEYRRAHDELVKYLDDAASQVVQAVEA